jgi:type II secretory pathway component GspD/PulD (secretin)
MIFLQQAEASAVKATLDEIVNQGGGSGDRVRIGVNTQSNIMILSGPRDRLNELIDIIEQLDVAEQVIPTVNKVIQLNYSNTDEIVEIITPILSENGQITEETRSGQVIVTDIPVKIEEITALVKEIDIPVEQVSIEAMVVDHVVDDKAESGVDLVGFSDGLFGFNSVLEGPATGGLMKFGFVVNDFELGGIISAELNNSDSELLANPVVVTLENQKASINISQEFPFRETQETGNGGVVSSTEFKDIGTVLEVTPQITFDRKIIAEIAAKQSNLIGFTQDGIPIEAKREAETTMRMEDGQTVYIAGLRRYDESIGDSKVPFLGDIPVLNFFFKKHKSEKTNNELMVFLTCNIIKDEFTELTPFEKEQYDLLGGKPLDETNAMRSMIDAYGKDPIRDPFYKWRRAK